MSAGYTVSRSRSVDAVRRLMTVPLSPVRWEGLHVFDREITANKAARLIRRGKSAKEVCAELGIRSDTLRSMGAEYGFSIPTPRPKGWPTPDDRGETDYSGPSYRKVHSKAVKGAAEQLKANGHVPPVKALKAKIDAVSARVFQPGERLVITSMDEVPLMPSATTDQIIAEVCEKYGVARKDMLSAIRSQFIMPARFEAIYRLREEKSLSWAQIGRIFNRDHTTCLAAWRRHKAMMEAFGQ